MKFLFAQKTADDIKANRLAAPHDKILVAVSGGADSVALLHVLAGLGYSCLAAHCNFHLRGKESLRDERFVVQLCFRLQIPCLTKEFNVPEYAAAHKVSVEMACRELRYAWFEEMRAENGCAHIAVAHHRDDSLETFFLNLLRGTGIAGLTGIKWKNGHVIRPLLNRSRQEIEEYLNCVGQDFVTDHTNAENTYARNRIRNIILPTLRSCFPDAEKAIRTTMGNLAEDNRIFQEAIRQTAEKITAKEGNIIRISRKQVLETASPSALLHKILSPYGFNATQVRQLCDALRTGSAGATFESGTTAAEAGREFITLFPKELLTDESEYRFRLADLSGLPVRLNMRITEQHSLRPTSADCACFDGSILNEELTLRHWKRGDRFHPFGMKGSKKLSDYFNDHKFSLLEKRTAWLLCCGNRIIWIVGHRRSSDFRVTPESEKTVILSVQQPSSPYSMPTERSDEMVCR